MSSFERCERCRSFVWDGQCKCVRFLCGIPFRDKIDGPDDLHVVWATDAESAAEKFAEDYDSNGDYTIIKNGSGEVWVIDVDDNQTKWSIEAESVPEYRAYEKVTPAQRQGNDNG